MSDLEFFGKKRLYKVDAQIASGGEGTIYSIKGDSGSLIKIYHQVSDELVEKLEYMAKNPPINDVLEDIAWPTDIIYDDNHKLIGFVMPKLIASDCTLDALYKYNDPSSNIKPILTYQNRVIVAINLCKVIDAVHKSDYVFGDFNPLNIGVNLTNGHIGFFDADSYHIFNKEENKLYRCKVGCDGYIAPEIIKKCKEKNPPYKYDECPLPTFTVETDRFALAIHIFKLLMNGFTPFNGIKETFSASTASPGRGNDAIEKDNYCFKSGNKPLSAATPTLDSFPEYLTSLWQRAFIDGRDNPSVRPTAEEWRVALEQYYQSLVPCSKNKFHFYCPTGKKKLCPYCEADARQIAAQTQTSFSTPVKIPKAPTVKTKRPRRPFNFKKFIGILISTLVIAGITLGIVFGVKSCSDKQKAYNASNFALKLSNKVENGSDSSYYYLTFDFEINNNSSVNVNSMYGHLTFYDYNYSYLLGFDISFSGYLDAGQTSYGTIDFKCSKSNSKSVTVYNSSYEELAISYKWTEIYFESGKSKTYKGEEQYIKRPTSYVPPSDNNGDNNNEVIPYDTIEHLEEAYVGSTVKFGKYPLDGSNVDYIPWKVLSIDKGEAELLCDYSLIGMPFREEWAKYVSWGSSQVRTYLNSSFYYNSFSDEERALIILSDIFINDEEKDLGGVNTSDYIYIPTENDLTSHFSSTNSIDVPFSGIYASSETPLSEDYGAYWRTFWCREAKKIDTNAIRQRVYSFDKSTYSGTFTYSTFDVYHGVRPMMRIKLNQI